MISNLQSARRAIEAELSHARQGITYYTERVKALEVALHQLETVEDDGKATSKSEKNHAGTKQAQTSETKRGRKARNATGKTGQPSSGNGSSHPRKGAKRRLHARVTDGLHEQDRLPSTGGDFWLKLVNDRPQSAVDILHAASSVLGVKPDQKEQIQKLRQRVFPALASLVSAQKIQDSGAGRARRFFRAHQAGSAGS